MSRSHPLFRLFAVLFAAALVFGACGGGDDGDNAPDAAETTEGTDEEEGGTAGSEDEGGGGECGGSGGETVDVEAANFAFKPNKISAPAGEQVTVNFTNTDDTPHTFTISDMSCDTSSVGGGASAELSFTMPDAETEWICNIHPDMKGTLTPE